MCVEGSDGITQGHLGGNLMSSDSFFPGLLLEWGFPVVGEVDQLDLRALNLSSLRSSHNSHTVSCYFDISLA